MKKLSILVIALTVVNFLSAQSSKTFDLDSFDAISISNSADVEFTQGPQSVSVSGPQELIDKLEVTVEKGSLNIQNKKGKSGNWSGNKNLVFKVSAPNLKALAISGSGDFVFASGLKADAFSMTVSGSGDVETKGDLMFGNLSIVISGSGDISLRGSSDKSSIVISGSGDLEAEALKCKTVNIVNSGSADIEIYASEKVSVVNSGSGDVEIEGNPEKKSIVNTGSGDIDYK